MYRARATVSRRKKKKALNGRMKIYMKAIMICMCKLTICLNKRALFVYFSNVDNRCSDSEQARLYFCHNA